VTRKNTLIAMLVLMAATATVAQAGNLYLKGSLDLSSTNTFGAPLFNNVSPNGNSPSAITTNGSSLWISGLNNTAAAGATGIVRIDNPWTAPAATNIKSIAATPASRGYSGLAFDPVDNKIFAAYDSGAAHPDGIAAFDIGTNTQSWSKNVRGGSGVYYDPGFGGVDRGAGYSGFGSGRRSLQDATTGADIYTSANGMIIGAGAGNWRDIAFAPNGDFYGRANNNVWKAVRDGGNSTSSQSIIVDLTDASGINGQNIEYMAGFPGGDLLVFNKRVNSSLGQPMIPSGPLLPDTGANQVGIFFTDTSGNQSSVALLDQTFNPLTPGFVFNSAGYWDFTWDQTNQELLILDFTNRFVYRFGYTSVPEPGSLALLGLGAIAIIRRRK